MHRCDVITVAVHTQAEGHVQFCDPINRSLHVFWHTEQSRRYEMAGFCQACIYMMGQQRLLAEHSQSIRVHHGATTMRASAAIPKRIGNTPLCGTWLAMAQPLLDGRAYKVTMLAPLWRRHSALAVPPQAWPSVESVRTSLVRGKNCRLLELNLSTIPQVSQLDDCAQLYLDVMHAYHKP